MEINCKTQALSTYFSKYYVIGIEYDGKAYYFFMKSKTANEYTVISYNCATGKCDKDVTDKVDSITSYYASLVSKGRDATQNRELEVVYFDINCEGSINCVFCDVKDGQLYESRDLNKDNFSYQMKVDKKADCIITPFNVFDNGVLPYIFKISKDGCIGEQTSKSFKLIYRYRPWLGDIRECLIRLLARGVVAHVSETGTGESKLVVINACLNHRFADVQREQLRYILQNIQDYLQHGITSIRLRGGLLEGVEQFLTEEVLKLYGLEFSGTEVGRHVGKGDKEYIFITGDMRENLGVPRQKSIGTKY